MVVNPPSRPKPWANSWPWRSKEPGKLSFGSGSSSSRIAGELLQQMADVKLLHVPYKSNPLGHHRPAGRPDQHHDHRHGHGPAAGARPASCARWASTDAETAPRWRPTCPPSAETGRARPRNGLLRSPPTRRPARPPDVVEAPERAAGQGHRGRRRQAVLRAARHRTCRLHAGRTGGKLSRKPESKKWQTIIKAGRASAAGMIFARFSGCDRSRAVNTKKTGLVIRCRDIRPGDRWLIFRTNARSTT